MPFVGEVLPLSFQLLDGDTSKFARAILKDEAGVDLGASPVSMPHIGGGKYTSSSVVMPVGVDYIEATYESFDDAGFTIEDEDHLLGTDVFRLEVPDSVIIDKLDEILAKLQGIALPGSAFNVVLVQNQIKEVIEDVLVTKALVERDDVKGIVMADQQTIGKVDNEEIVTEVEE